MKPIRCPMLLLALLSASIAASAQQSPAAESARFHLFDNQDFTVDLVGVDQGAGGGEVGAEWKFDLRRDVDVFPDVGNTHVAAHLRGNGFLTLTSGDNERDQIKTELELDFLPLFAVDPPGGITGLGFWGELEADQVCVSDEAFAELIERDYFKAYVYPEGLVPNVEEDPPEKPGQTCIFLTDLDAPTTPQSVRDLLNAISGKEVKVETVLARSIQRARQQAVAVASPFSIQGQANVSWETTQDLENHDVVVGLGFGVATSYFSALLDLPFGVLRTSPNNNPRMVDARLSYEYVGKVARGGKADFAGATTDVSRLSLEAEWETGIFKSDRVSFYYNLKHELDASGGTKARGRETNHFFQARFEHLLIERPNAEVDVAIVYTRGELSPVFERGHNIGGGFSVRF